MDNFFDYFIMHMFILGYITAMSCSFDIFNKTCKYNIYLCMDNQMYDHNFWWYTKCIIYIYKSSKIYYADRIVSETINSLLMTN